VASGLSRIPDSEGHEEYLGEGLLELFEFFSCRSSHKNKSGCSLWASIFIFYSASKWENQGHKRTADYLRKERDDSYEFQHFKRLLKKLDNAPQEWVSIGVFDFMLTESPASTQKCVHRNVRSLGCLNFTAQTDLHSYFKICACQQDMQHCNLFRSVLEIWRHVP